MSTPQSQPAQNTLLQFGDGMSPEGWTTVANVSSYTGPSMSAKVDDVTSHSTGIPWRSKTVSLLDAGTVSFKVWFVPGDTGHKALLALFTGRALKDWRLVYPDTGATKWPFSGTISKFNINIPVDGQIDATLDIAITGEPNFPA